MIRRLSTALLCTCLAATTPGAIACAEVLRGDAVTLERDHGSARDGDNAGVQILGAGWFRAATVTKVGGTTHDTTLTVELDGEPLVSATFATLRDGWRQVQSGALSVTLAIDGDVSTLTVWYPDELKFRALANLRVDVHEDGVQSLRVSAILNKPAPHEHVPGSPAAVAGLPAFK
jgi:hypothetical protein